MNEHRAHDDDGSLTPCVRRFRRLARLAAADPLRLLPPDALTRLSSLGAPVAALIAVEPFERLRHAVAPTTPGARSDVARARLQPLIRNRSGMRPHATPALDGLSSRAAAARDAAGMPTARHIGPPSHVSDAQPGGAANRQAPRMRLWEQRTHTDVPSTATLAQRRAALRRNLADGGTPAQPSPLVPVQASTAAGHQRDASQPLSGAGTPGPRDSVAAAPLASALRRLTALPPESRVVQREHRSSGGDATSSMPARTLPVDAPHRASTRVDAAIAPAAGFAGNTSDHALLAAAARTRAFAPSLDARAGSPAAIGPPVLPGRDAPQVEANATGQPRSRQRIAALEFTDDLFETLYRNGVDLSWP